MTDTPNPIIKGAREAVQVSRGEIPAAGLFVDGHEYVPKAERYGKVKVSKIRAAFNDLRTHVRSGDMEAAEAALDRYEPWADYVFNGGAKE